MIELKVELLVSFLGITKRSQIILTYDGVEGGAVGELFGDNKALQLAAALTNDLPEDATDLVHLLILHPLAVAREIQHLQCACAVIRSVLRIRINKDLDQDSVSGFWLLYSKIICFFRKLLQPK